MLQFLLDTDHLTLFQYGQAMVTQKLAKQSPGVIGLAVVTVEESIRGRLTAIAQAQDGGARIARYSLFLESLRVFQQFPFAPFDQAAENQFQQLRSLKLRVGSQDLKIAAIALANRVALITRNQRDFGKIPGLALEDWSM